MLFTIGHSNHDIETFIELLKRNGVTALADVRSHPYSRYLAHFSKDALKVALSDAGIAYTFLGKEFGARSPNPACYKNGKVQYDLLAQQPEFSQGIERVREGMRKFNIAFMCAEKDPAECHRALLVARKFFEAGNEVCHILADGSLETHEHLEARLLKLWKLPEGDMFRSRAECVQHAYALQGERVAYQDEEMMRTGTDPL